MSVTNSRYTIFEISSLMKTAILPLIVIFLHIVNTGSIFSIRLMILLSSCAGFLLHKQRVPSLVTEPCVKSMYVVSKSAARLTPCLTPIPAYM